MNRTQLEELEDAVGLGGDGEVVGRFRIGFLELF